MACQTAVVASAVGGIKEVVIPNETGILASNSHMGSSTTSSTGMGTLKSSASLSLSNPLSPAKFNTGGSQIKQSPSVQKIKRVLKEMKILADQKKQIIRLRR